MTLQKIKIKSIKKIESNSKRYDIEVEDNHNFFANGILVHNCSATYAINKGKFYVMSRTLVRRIEKVKGFFKWVKLFKPNVEKTQHMWVDNGVWEEIAFKFDLMRKLSSLNRNIAIQGEIVGPGIQGNKYKFSELQFFCYGAYDIENQKYLNQRDWYALMLQLKIPMVPLIDTNFILNDQTVDNLLEYARGNSTKAPIPREGVVFRLLDDKGSKISFKVVNNDFLIEFGE